MSQVRISRQDLADGTARSLVSGPLSPSRCGAIAIGLVCAVATFYLATIRTGHVWGDDHCAYIQHAKNLVDGVKYEATGYLRSPTSINPKAYPPGFPLLLAPIYLFCGLNLMPMKVMEIAFFCASLILLFHIIKSTAPPLLALATIVLTGFSPYFWDFKDSVLSDIPFLAFTYAVLLVAIQTDRYQTSMQRAIVLGVVAGGLAYLAYCIRSVGIILLPTLLLQDFVKARRVTIFSAVAGIVFIVAALGQKLAVTLGSDYLDTWARVISFSALLGSAKYYFICLTTLWDNGHDTNLQIGTYVLASIVALYGIWMRVHKQWTVLETFTLLYALLIICFPWGGKRYLIPIMPIYFFYFVSGLYELNALRSGHFRIALPAVASTVVLACFGAKYETVNWREMPNGTQGAQVAEMVNYVNHDIAARGTIVFSRARFLALYAGARTVDIYEAPASEEVLEFYRNSGVTHVITTNVTDPRGNRCLSQLVEHYPNLFAKTFGNEDFSIYRLNRL